MAVILQPLVCRIAAGGLVPPANLILLPAQSVSGKIAELCPVDFRGCLIHHIGEFVLQPYAAAVGYRIIFPDHHGILARNQHVGVQVAHGRADGQLDVSRQLLAVPHELNLIAVLAYRIELYVARLVLDPLYILHRAGFSDQAVQLHIDDQLFALIPLFSVHVGGLGVAGKLDLGCLGQTEGIVLRGLQYDLQLRGRGRRQISHILIHEIPVHHVILLRGRVGDADVHHFALGVGTDHELVILRRNINAYGSNGCRLRRKGNRQGHPGRKGRCRHCMNHSSASQFCHLRKTLSFIRRPILRLIGRCIFLCPVRLLYVLLFLLLLFLSADSPDNPSDDEYGRRNKEPQHNQGRD